MIKNDISQFKTLNTYTMILIVFILVNPVIDVVTSIGIREFDISLSIGILLKGLFLLYSLLAFLRMKSRNGIDKAAKYILFAFILYAAVHILLSLQSFGLSRTISAIVTMVKTFYLPLIVLSLYRLIEKKDIPLLTRTLVYSAVFVASIIGISMITGTDYNAYRYGKTGTVGWFYAANEVSALLGILTPILIYFIMEKLKVSPFIKIAIIAAYTFLYYQIGTKVVALSVIMTVLYVLVLFVIRRAGNKRLAVIKPVVTLSVLFILSVGLVPVTPIGINLNLHNNLIQDRYEDNIDEENPESDEDIKKDFGIDELLDNEEVLMSLVFSGRDEYFTVRKFIYDRAGITEKLFGLTQFAVTNTSQIKSYIIEIDYFDIFFNFGIIGSLFYWVIVLGALGYSIRNAFRNWRIFEPGSVLPYYLCSVILAFGIAMFAGHVFVSPSVSFYLALIISILTIESDHTKRLSLT